MHIRMIYCLGLKSVLDLINKNGEAISFISMFVSISVEVEEEQRTNFNTSNYIFNLI